MLDTTIRFPQKSDVAAAARTPLEWLLHPMTLEEFLEEYWEKKPLHLSRGDPGYYSELFELDDLDRFIGYSLTNDEIRMAKEGRTSYPRVEGHEQTSIGEFYDLYCRGNTIVVRNLHLCWESVGRMVNDLSRELGCRVGTHLYPTPEDSQGFTAHWDDHDIFALQLNGAKEWRLYDKGPRVPRYSTNRLEFRRHLAQDLNAPDRIINLQKGDLLYFPKGVIHEARAQTDSSLHLTFGLYPETWEQLLIYALKEAEASQGQLRRSLPPGFLVGELDREAWTQRLSALVPELLEQLDFDRSIAALAAHVVSKVEPMPDGHFARLQRLEEITLETALEKRAGVVTTITETEEEITLHAPGWRCRQPSSHAAALRHVDEYVRFRVADLPADLPEQQRIELMRQLVSGGVLKVVAGRESL